MAGRRRPRGPQDPEATLSSQHELPRLGPAVRPQDTEIDPRRHGLTAVVEAIPGDLVRPLVLPLLHERGQAAAVHVMDRERDGAGPLERVVDAGLVEVEAAVFEAYLAVLVGTGEFRSGVDDAADRTASVEN